jgi:hypothetical protein
MKYSRSMFHFPASSTKLNEAPQHSQVDWVFEQVTKPTNYTELARRGKKQTTSSNIVERKVGQSYASFWMIENQKAQPNHIPSSDSNQQILYQQMFEKLVGKQELARIEKQYKMRSSSNARVTRVSELLNRTEV